MQSFSLTKLLKTSTFRDTSITTVGTLINGFLGALFYILLARFLGPAEFGIISLSILILTLIVDVADLGLDTGIVRFVGKYKGSDSEKAKKFLKLSLKILLIVSVVILIVGIILSGYLSEVVFDKPELQPTLAISFVGVLTMLLLTFTSSSLQAYERFYAWSGINVLTNFLRVLIVAIFIYTATLTSKNAMIIYVLMPAIGFVGGMMFLPKGFLKTKNENSVSKELFQYSKWVAGFSAIAAVSSRLDTFMTARLLTTFELGIYSAASRLVNIGPQLASAIGTAIAPKFASIDTDEKAKEYIKKLQIFVGAIVLVGLVLLIPISRLIPLVLSEEYVLAVPVFVVLALGMLIFIFSVPIHQSIFHYFAYPRLFMWLAIINMIIVLGVGYYAIVSFGIMGAATTVLLVSAFNFVIPLIYVLKKFR